VENGGNLICYYAKENLLWFCCLHQPLLEPLNQRRVLYTLRCRKIASILFSTIFRKYSRRLPVNRWCYIPTNIGKVAFTFLNLKENGSNRSWKVIGEVFVFLVGVNFAQFAK
jgi:hypothetical protein